MELKIEIAKVKKQKPEKDLKFGKYFTDHMFIMEYENGKWDNARITPYAPFSLDPAAVVFHYGQAVFEGAKAFKNDKGEIRLFRFNENLKRLNDSCERICIPKIDEEFIHGTLKKLINIDKDWIPTSLGTSLYIRPTIIATDSSLGVHASTKYIFFIILSPVGAYYANGLAPVKLYVEEKYVRAPRGGTGSNKIAANYAVSLKASEEAVKKGYDQVMWLDAREQKYVEEVGSMNIMFVLNGEVVTPSLCGSILPGITRKSIIQLLKDKNIAVQEREISIDEIIEGVKSGKLTEIFGTGTAAVISPVGQFMYKDTVYTVNNGNMGGIAQKMYDELTGIQTGRLQDKFNWIELI